MPNPAVERVFQSLLRGRSCLASVPELEREPAQRDLALTGRVVPLSTAEPFRWTSKVCRSTSELQQNLQWSAGLAGGVGPVPLLKARQEFFESLHTTVFSVSLVVQARRVVAAMACEEVACKPDLLLPTDGAALDAFVATYGDSFVQAVEVGGHMQGVYTLYAQTREQAKQVATAIELLVSTGTVSLGPSFSRDLKTLAKEANVNVSCQVSIAGLANPPQITEATMADFASGFGAIELDKPEVLALQTKGYEAVAALRNVFAPVAQNRSLLCGQGSTPGLLRQWQRLREIVNQCNWVEGTYAIYGVPQDPALVPNRQRLRADIRDIEALCQRYQQSPSTPLTPPLLKALQTGSPRLQVQLSDGPVMGGRGGEPFRYLDRENAIRRRRRLVQVGLRAGNRIDQIRLRYHQEPAGEADEWLNASHGGEGGSDLGDLELATGVAITQIHAQSGIPNGRVDQVLFTTSDGQRIGGGRAYTDDTELNWQAAANQVLLGFSGRSKAELDSLWALIATFAPLAWEPVRLEEDP
jgi:hypothetical protein